MAHWAAAALAVAIFIECTSTAPPSVVSLIPGTSATAPVRTLPPSPTATRGETPTVEFGDVLLRMTVGGGLRYPGATVEEPPRFTLYEGGRVIYTTRATGPPDVSSRYDLWQAQLESEQVAALVSYALDDAGLAAARNRYDDIPIADDATTWFEVHADGVDKTVAVYAIDYDEDPVPDADARLGFRRLADELSSFNAKVESGEVADLGRFEPEAYLVTLDQPFGPEQQPRDWPWADLAPGDFRLAQAGWRQAVITRAQAVRLGDPLNSLPDNLVVRAPDGALYLLRIRPLLPDELP